MRNFIGEIKKSHPLYIMALPGVVLFLLFNYLPMAGIQVAFRHFNFREGLFRSEWVGFENFRFVLTPARVARVVWTIFFLNISSIIVVHTIFQISGALMLNELRALVQEGDLVPDVPSKFIESVNLPTELPNEE